MSDYLDDFSSLMRLVAEGHPNAFARLFHLYNPTLLSHLRSRLERIRWLRPLLDPDDIAQKIWLAFFTNATRRNPFAAPDWFVAYLARMAHHQILKATHHYLDAKKRDLRRHRHLSESAAGAAAVAVVDLSPAPPRTVEIQETFQRWLECLPSEQRQVALRIGEGRSHHEIAAELGCCVRTIDRMVKEIRRFDTVETA